LTTIDGAPKKDQGGRNEGHKKSKYRNCRGKIGP